jgi:hypothetical protein
MCVFIYSLPHNLCITKFKQINVEVSKECILDQLTSMDPANICGQVTRCRQLGRKGSIHCRRIQNQ